MSETSQIQFDQQTRAFEQMKSKLGDAGMSLLDDQLDVWAELNGRPLESPLKTALANGDTRLPEGTLLHGMGMHGFSAVSVAGVAEMGIVSGELLGITEDSETHGCADFFRVPEETTIRDYFASAKEPEVLGGLKRQRSERMLTSGVAFIVDAQAEGMDTLLAMDGYRNSEMANFVKPPSGRNAEDTAAILGGVPRGAIAGIVVNPKLAGNAEHLADIVHSFGGVPLFSVMGELVSNE